MILVTRQQQVRPLAVIFIGDTKHREATIVSLDTAALCQRFDVILDGIVAILEQGTELLARKDVSSVRVHYAPFLANAKVGLPTKGDSQPELTTQLERLRVDGAVLRLGNAQQPCSRHRSIGT